MAINTAAVTFTAEEQTALKHVISTHPKITREDVLKLVGIGAIKTEDADVMVKTLPLSPEAEEHKHLKHCAFKKALLELAKDKNDPDYAVVLDLHKQLHEAFERIEQKYGSEATVNQGSVVGKVETKLSTDVSPASVSIAKKVAEFQ